ncbi:MAG: DUF5011 domain-containing protein [bacterium]|nr:DUF5011 domain-containing protein [bacterium]
MKKAKLILITALAVFGVWVIPAHAATYTVNVSDNDLGAHANADPAPDGSCVADGGGGNDCSLREAFIAADTAGGTHTINVPADTITLQISGIGEDNSATGDLDVSGTASDITVQGDSATTTIIDGNGAITGDRVFDVFALNTLTLQDITVTGGVLSGVHAASGATTVLNVIDSIVTDNSNVAGGGISVDASATVTITRSTIKDNTANDGAGVAVTTAALTVVDSTFTGNNGGADNDDVGGAIYISGESDISIEQTTIANNTAGGGGGIASVCGVSTHSIINSTITGNAADNIAGNGGGILSYCSHPSVGVADVFDISHSTISGNSAEGSGGGIHAQGEGNDLATVRVKNSILSGNSANSVADEDCDISGAGTPTITSQNYNIEGGTSCGFTEINDHSSTDPLLDVAGLENNGGENQTISIQSTSPAKDTGTCSSLSGTETRDQRGLVRPENSTCDVGAYELDQTNPTITATGDSTVIQECTSTYTDSGATATDNFDSTISAAIISNNVDTDILGSYSVAYSATDNDGNIGTAIRTVNVTDTKDPVITMAGDSSVTVKQGATYADAGATATDTCDSDKAIASYSTGTLETDISDVNTNKLGTYTVTYIATDDSGNIATSTRDVEVVSRGDVTKVTSKKNSKVMLTYEDDSTLTCTAFTKGKGKPKAKLSKDGNRLIVLKKNGIKVRIFNTANCVQKSSKKVRNKGQKISRLGVFNFYKTNKKNEVIVTTKKNGKLRTTSLKLSPKKKGSKLAKRNTKVLDPFTKKKFKLKKKHKRVQIKNGGKVIIQYKVNKKARLKNWPS